MTERIYLDYAATAPVHADVRAAMEPYLSDAFGNPSSLHADGQRARHALDDARDAVAQALGAQAAEITFTSGGTESDNAALVGVLLGNRQRGDHLVTTQVEHEAVLNAARFLETLGVSVTYLPVDGQGRVSPGAVAAALTDRTVLVSVMHANNEVGTVQPLREIAAVARARGVLLHADAVQTFGQFPVTVEDLGADLLTLSGHKISGPKGVGALYVRSGVPIAPFLHGGAQERERRAGTENVPGIVGLAAAVRRLLPGRGAEAARLARLRDGFIRVLTERIPGLALNGDPTERLPNNVHVSVPGVDAESLLLALDLAGVSASSGSACTAGSIEPSHVLRAMGLPDWRVRNALRLTLGHGTTEAQLCRTADILAGIVGRANRGHP